MKRTAVEMAYAIWQNLEYNSMQDFAHRAPNLATAWMNTLPGEGLRRQYWTGQQSLFQLRESPYFQSFRFEIGIPFDNSETVHSKVDETLAEWTKSDFRTCCIALLDDLIFVRARSRFQSESPHSKASQGFSKAGQPWECLPFW